MIRPMPFWPSFEPWAKDTPVQVKISRPRIHSGGGSLRLRLGVELRLADQELHDQQQQRRSTTKPTSGEISSALPMLIAWSQSTPEVPLRPCSMRIGDADADDRADQRVRARGRQAEAPGAEVPDDRRDQQREHHREAGVRADLQDQFDRQQRDDAEGDRAGRGQHAEEVEEARPDHREVGHQRMGVDDGRDRVGGVVEAVDEFEAERDQQRHGEQQVDDERVVLARRPTTRRSRCCRPRRRGPSARTAMTPIDRRRAARHSRPSAGLGPVPCGMRP